jgi:hypothetical protein
MRNGAVVIHFKKLYTHLPADMKENHEEHFVTQPRFLPCKPKPNAKI